MLSLSCVRFAFTTDKTDMFSLCFYSRVPRDMQGGRHEVFFSTKHGVEAKNYEDMGDAAKLKPLEVCRLSRDPVLSTDTLL